MLAGKSARGRAQPKRDACDRGSRAVSEEQRSRWSRAWTSWSSRPSDTFVANLLRDLRTGFIWCAVVHCGAIAAFSRPSAWRHGCRWRGWESDPGKVVPHRIGGRGAILDALTRRRHAGVLVSHVDEPEEAAIGSHEAMNIAHESFTADRHCITAYLRC